jgi:integrase
MTHSDTTRRLGQIIPRDSNNPHQKFLVRFYIGRDANGKRKYRSETISGPRELAEQTLNALLRGERPDATFTPSSALLLDYVSSWLDTRKGLSPSTSYEYGYWLQRAQPCLANWRLNQLTRRRIQLIYGSLSSDHNIPRSGIARVKTIISQALAQAVRDKLIESNPCDGVRPKDDKAPKGRVMRCLTAEQSAQIIESTRRQYLGALWRLLLTTGLRPYETLALKWQDIQERDGAVWLTVNRSVTRDATGCSVVKEYPEANTTTRRKLSITSELLTSLKQSSRESAEGYVFPNASGELLNARDVRRKWHRVTKRCELGRVRLYDVRHSSVFAMLTETSTEVSA